MWGTFDGREAAVRFENARATVIGGTFQGNSRVEYGVRIDGGSDHEIRDVRVADLNANLGAGIDVGGDRSLVRNVTVERVHEGVVARGTLLRILDNRVERTTGDGVFVSGDAPRVRRNLVVLSNANGLFVGGIEAEVTANVVRDSARDGLGLSGGRTVARDNVITGSGGDGVFLFTDGITLENTTVADSRGGGIVSQGDGTVIRGAAVRNTGGTAVDYAGGNRGDNLLLADVLIDGAFAGVNVSRGTNVTLDGVRVNDTDEAGISLGVYSRNVGNVSGSLVRNVTVTNAGDDAIRLGTGRDVRLEDVTVAGGSGDGVAARSVADLSLIGVAVANVSGTGVRTDRTAGLVLEEVRATDNGGVGVSVGGQLGTDSTVRARGVRAERNGGAGVSLRVVTGGTLRDLALRNNGGTGLSAVFTSDVAVRNLSTTDNSGFGAALLSRNVTLSDTVATGNGDGPLSVPSGAPNAVENLTTERARLSATVTSNWTRRRTPARSATAGCSARGCSRRSRW
ncbi:MAG: right-handed parallel beta-helix repeat-containing protein [Haloarculaceae archaeon]